MISLFSVTVSMMKVNVTPKLIFCGFLIKAATSSNLKCDSTFDQTNQVQWPNTATKTVSIPPCIGQDKELVYRECLNGTWSPEPSCFSIQQNLRICPENLTEVGRICYTLSAESTYPPKCPSNDVLPFESYRYLISETIPLWMPITRNLSNGFGFMQWMEASTSYKTDFIEYSLDLDIEDHNCIIAYGGDYMMAASCNETHPRICAYKMPDPWVNNDFCQRFGCVQKDFFDRSKCICLGATIEGFPSDVEFLSIFDNNAFHALPQSNCSMALEKINDTYMWTRSLKEINYTHWSTNVVFDSTHIYGAFSPDGWSLTPSRLPCSLYVINITILEPQLKLYLVDGIFSLEIQNSEFLTSVSDLPVFCFTNADETSLIYRYSNLRKVAESSASMIIQFETITDAPGHYWCEGFKYDDLAVITSNTIVTELKSGYSEFVAFVSVQKDAFLSYDALAKGTIDLVDSTLFSIFRSTAILKDQYSLRFMKIQDIDRKNVETLANIHITFLKNSTEEEDAFNSVKTLIENILNSLRMPLVEFFSASYCYEETVGNLTWPITYLGEKSIAYQFCFKPDGTRLSRLCDGTFIDGARWSDYEDCEIIPRSTLSGTLLPLLYFDVTNATDVELSRILIMCQEFKVLDVYIVAEIYKKHTSSNDVNVEAVAKTVNHMLQSPDRSILKEAQLKTRATDTILDFLENIAFTYPSSFDISLNNFTFKSLEINSLTGITVFENHSIHMLTGAHTIEDILEIENLKSSVWVAPDIWNNTLDTKVTFSLFHNDYFFTERKKLKLLDTIFGVILSNGTVNMSLNVLHKIQNVDEGEFCHSWFYNSSTKGFWIVSSQPQLYLNFALCEFHQSGYFGLSLNLQSTGNTNVTGDLMNVLDSNDTASATMQKLENISERYHFFQPIDLSYVAEILERMSKKDEQVDLKCLTKIVSNLEKIDHDVLYESQKTQKATDGILQHVDSIVEKHEHTEMIEIIDENFVVVVVNTEETDFAGLALFWNKENLQVKILDQNLTIDDAIKNSSFDSAVLIDPNLRSQLPSKVVVTIFGNDALFNEKNPNSKSKGAIFGVMLPEIEKFSGPVSILYKLEAENSTNQCSYWKYDNNSPGFWEKEGDIKLNNLSLAQCDFWHTTHFSLLLMDGKSDVDEPKALAVVELVATVNTVISLISLTCIILTGIFFKSWRSDLGNQILLNFVVVMIFQLIAFYVSSTITRHSENEHYILCLVAGVVLHYTTISQFCWMLVVAILQFRRFVEVLKAPPKNVLSKSCVCGWVVPLIPVIPVLLADRDSYVVFGHGLCYPSHYGLYLGVWLPLALIVIINSIIYVNIIWNVIRKKTVCADSGNREIMYQLRLAILLFFMLGLTWAFGLFANFENVFLYLFCCTASLQGFVIFIFFIVCNPKTMYLYVQSTKKFSFKTKK